MLAEDDRLAALWWLIALRGLRRGETAALDRDDLDSEAQELDISRQVVALPGELYCGPPKSRASIRTIALDKACTQRLVDQAIQQNIELLRHQFTEQRRSDSRVGPDQAGGPAGRCSPMPTGGRSGPEYLTHRFHMLIMKFDLPPVRLHDLRQGAATLALASHTDLKVIQQMVGHSSIVTAADTYTKRPARNRSPGSPGHRRHGYSGRPQIPRIQARRDDRAPHPGRRRRLRLLPDVSPRSSIACGTSLPGDRAGPAAISRRTRA